MTAPCFTPLVIGNFSDMSLFHRTLANWLEYITNRRRTYVAGIPLSKSLLNRTLCWTVSKTFFISITQTKTSEPFLIKWSIVSTAIQVHMFVEHCSWYPNCSSSKYSLSPYSKISTQSKIFRTRLLIAIDRYGKKATFDVLEATEEQKSKKLEKSKKSRS